MPRGGAKEVSRGWGTRKRRTGMCHNRWSALLQTYVQPRKSSPVSYLSAHTLRARGATVCLLSQGYDFGFLRHSRLYEECSQRTGYAWTTQYVGGKKLAVCNSKDGAYQTHPVVDSQRAAWWPMNCRITFNEFKCIVKIYCETLLSTSHFPESIFPASGLEASYFPKDQDCLTAKKSAELWNGITSILVSELRARNVQGEPRFACLVCGWEEQDWKWLVHWSYKICGHLCVWAQKSGWAIDQQMVI